MQKLRELARKSSLRPFFVAFALTGVLGMSTVACEDNDGPLEEVGEDLDDVVDEVKDVGDN